MPFARNVSLIRVKLAHLRPTQLSVGYAEVQLKAAEWKQLKKKQRKLELEHSVFPAVLGARDEHYIIDHHHLGIALIEQDVKEVWVAQIDDLSWLNRATFWRTLEFRSWAHPYDHLGKRRDYRDIPCKLTQLQNDPYRGLAGLVRRAGGYAKQQTPFAEFLWADFFRIRIAAAVIANDLRQAVRIGLKLARSEEARYLPGWTGKVLAPALR